MGKEKDFEQVVLEKLDARREWHLTPVLLPGKSHGWRSLVSYSPWGRKESDMTERLHFFSLNSEQASQSLSEGWASLTAGSAGVPSSQAGQVRPGEGNDTGP